MKKILVMYATAGIGHKKASLAIKQALDELGAADCAVTLIDSLDHTSEFFKKAYLGSYLFMVNEVPTFWGASYYLTGNYYVNLLGAKLRRMSNTFHGRKLEEFLMREDFDVIVSTHFFGSEVVATMKRSGKLRARLITVVTDYRLHSWWVNEPTDTYVVASDDTKDDLARWKVDPSRVRVMGIPVEPTFARPCDRQKVLGALSFKVEIFTILVIGGGFGVGPIEDIVRSANGLSRPAQVIVICGHNEELKKRIDAIRPNPGMTIKTFGFVDNVYEYMEVADILISKSGGITVSESMAKGLPMLVIAPILGQETGNSDFLVKHGAAITIDAVPQLGGVLEDLAAHPEKIAALRANIDRIRKPNACYDIAHLALDTARS